MKHIAIDRSKPLKDDPSTGHNRWHPDISPVIEAAPGEEVAIETRDAADGQVKPGMTAADIAGLDPSVVHPLTGPVYVKGAVPGDLLEVEYLEIEARPYGWTRMMPTAGFLRDLFPEYYLVHWDLCDDWATSPQLPGVRIPNGAFMGTAGLAPSRDQLAAWTRREADLKARGGRVALPDPVGAVPGDPAIAREALRTHPPRENCGNLDAKQLTRGARLLIPVNVAGALFSVGDAHYAQGDSECCINAIEMEATAVVRFRVHAGEAARKNIRWPRFAHPDYFIDPRWAAPRNFIATVGVPVNPDGTQEGENLTLAARNALINMIDLLEERGWTRQQAYVICSVAVDLKVSNLVDLPNVAVSAFLPEDIFEDAS